MPAAACGRLLFTRSVHSSFGNSSKVERIAALAEALREGRVPNPLVGAWGERSGAFAVRASALGTTRSTPERRATRGFTLLEILLTVAIIGLLGSVLIGGSARLLNEQPVTPDEMFWKAVQESRKTALKNEKEVRLKFDKDKKHFALIDGQAPSVVGDDGVTKEETPLKIFTIPPAAADGLTMEFLGASSKGANAILVGGVLLEAASIPYVTFYSDGTCSAFRLQVTRGGGTHTLSIDPWTCAQVLTPTDPNALIR